METKSAKKRIPAVEGWFTMGSEPSLIGNHCKTCGDYFFPKSSYCRNPKCMGKDLEEVLLSRKGKLWSYTVNYYQPPPPYISPDPFVPYGLAVVQLAKEKMDVAGQVVSGYDFEKLKVGMDMELVLEKLTEDKQGNEVMVWKWKPLLAKNT
jgi:uncharacterized protein